MKAARRQRSDEKGAALLSVLLVVAALSAAAVVASAAIARQTDTSRAAARRADAGWAALSAEALARSAIADLMRTTAGQVNVLTPGLGEPVAFAARGGVISLSVEDAANCLNLNSFASASDAGVLTARTGMIRLLDGIGVPEGDASALADTLADWIDADSTPRARGAEDEYYLSLDPPYRTANGPLESPRELAAILGYTPALREALAPLVCALPGPAQAALNLNTLKPEQAPLLRALYAPDLRLQTAERLLEQRPTGGWRSVEDFEALPDIRTLPAGAKASSAISVSTTVFAASGLISTDGGTWPFDFIISASEGQAPRTIWRRLGED
ncbi:type II secretion system minor pseudopilin GspK [Hyphomonas sp.]|uniref:type II secretion system minor pseudopilin GspK n=1 Tax=Hyphomonas sp. TaxID=87 RepID=UPI0039189B80